MLSCDGIRECESGPAGNARDWCYLGKAEARSQPKLCDFIKDRSTRNRCVEHLAINRAQPDLCRKVVDAADRASCCQTVALATKSAASCELLNGDERDGCLSYIGRDLKRHDICSLIQAPSKRAYCFEDIARYATDPQVCDWPEVVRLRDLCLASVVGDAVTRGQARSDLCDRMQDQEARSRCNRTAARADPPLCEKVGDSAADPNRIDCYRNLYWRPFAAICDRIPSGTGSDLCWQEAAQQRKDQGLCEKVKAGRARDGCLLSLVHYIEGDGMCRLIRDEKVALECIEALEPRFLNDVTICRRFRDSYKRDECVFVVRHDGRKP